MIKELTAAALHDLIGVLKQHPDFFQKSAEEKAQFPAVSAMLKDISSEVELLEAMSGVMGYLKGTENGTGNVLLVAVAHYFAIDFPAVFDNLDKVYYGSSWEEQKEKLDELLPEKGLFYDTLKSYLLVESPQDLTESIIVFLQDICNSPRLLVQSSAECDSTTKTEIRGHFAKKYPQSFVQFRVNSQLIGGIRFFVDGEVDDHSWFGRIQDIKRLETLVS